MAESTARTPQSGFWESQAVVDHVKGALSSASRILGAETTPEASSPDELRKAYSDLLTSYKISELGEEERGRCRNLLLLPLKGLVRMWKRQMEAGRGASFWKKAKESFNGDSRTLAWLDLLHEIATGHNQDALNDLEDLSKVGMKWRRATGTEQSEKHQDYGLEYIWVVTRLVEARLSRSETENGKSSYSQEARLPVNRPELRMRINNFGELELRYKMRERKKRSPELLNGKPKQLLMVLASKDYGERRNDWDEFIWDEIWNPKRGDKLRYRRATKKTGQDDGVNKRLSRLVHDTVTELTDLLDAPPYGRWILRLRQEGTRKSAYRLTDSVVWHLD